MSRCFPYPPPGYTLSGDRKEALIESIKLQKDKVKSEEQRKKERKREKKEKRKEKKLKTTHQNHEKEKFRENSKVVQCPIDENPRAAADVKGQSLLHKVSKAEADQLERSSLTEERGEPVLLPSTSSDSTENSNKRKRQSAPLDLDCTRAHGKIIRIKLSSKKPNESIDASVNEQQTCSTSGRTDFPSFSKDDAVLRQRTEELSSCTLMDRVLGSARDQKVELIPAQKMCVPSVTTSMQRSALTAKSNTGQQVLVTAARDQICSISQPTEPVQKTQVPHLSRVQRSALRYKNLTEMWVPPQLEFAVANDTDDVDWLFRSKKDVGISSEKRCISGNDGMSCSSSSSLWPRAQYLQEVDLYALPYTIPY